MSARLAAQSMQWRRHLQTRGHSRRSEVEDSADAAGERGEAKADEGQEKSPGPVGLGHRIAQSRRDRGLDEAVQAIASHDLEVAERSQALGSAAASSEQ